MGDLLFNNVSLCPRYFDLYHLFSDCSLSQPSSLSLHLFFFLLYCPLFQHPVLSSPPMGHDSQYQIEFVRMIFLVWSQKPTMLLKDTVIGGVPRCMPSRKGGALNLGQCRHTNSVYPLPSPPTFH